MFLLKDLDRQIGSLISEKINNSRLELTDETFSQLMSDLSECTLTAQSFQVQLAIQAFGIEDKETSIRNAESIIYRLKKASEDIIFKSFFHDPKINIDGRDSFEAWFSDHMEFFYQSNEDNIKDDLRKDDLGKYIFLDAHRLWLAWQAGASQSLWVSVDNALPEITHEQKQINVFPYSYRSSKPVVAIGSGNETTIVSLCYADDCNFWVDEDGNNYPISDFQLWTPIPELPK